MKIAQSTMMYVHVTPTRIVVVPVAEVVIFEQLRHSPALQESVDLYEGHGCK